MKTNRTPLTKETLMTQYSNNFQGTGKFEEPYNLTVEPDSVPVVHPLRPVPLALKEELKEKLDWLEGERYFESGSRTDPLGFENGCRQETKWQVANLYRSERFKFSYSAQSLPDTNNR